MKRLLFIFTALLLCSDCWAATYYVDKRSAGGNGTTTALTGVNAAFKNPGFAAVGDRAHGSTIKIVENTGPYYVGDFATYAFLWARTNNTVWDLGGNEITGGVDFNALVTAGTHKWTQSASAPTQYYLQTAAGGNPSINQVKSCVLDNVWNDDTTKIGAGKERPGSGNNFRWGDFDALGYSTLYVRYVGGNPTSSGISVIAAQQNTGFVVQQLTTGTVIHNGTFSHFNGGIIISYGSTTLHHLTLKYCDAHAVGINGYVGAQATVYRCRIIDTGHRAFYIGSPMTHSFYNNYISGAHLAIAVIDAAENLTLNYKNNIAVNLYAGAIDTSTIDNITMDETNNIFQIDSSSPHASPLRYNAAGLWIKTHATDFPSAIDTTGVCSALHLSNCGVADVYIDANGIPTSSSPAINAGTYLGATYNTDYAGNPVPMPAGTGLTDIGAYEFQYGTASGGGMWGDMWGGSGMWGDMWGGSGMWGSMWGRLKW